MIVYIYTQYIILNNYKDKNGSLKLTEYRSFSSFFFGGERGNFTNPDPKILPNYYANTPMQYTVIFHSCKNTSFQTKHCDIFPNFAQNIEAVLMCTHILCFGAKIRKKYTPVNASFTI